MNNAGILLLRHLDSTPRTSSIYQSIDVPAHIALKGYSAAKEGITLPQYPFDPTWATLRDDLAMDCWLILNRHRLTLGLKALTLELSSGPNSGALGGSSAYKSMHMCRYLYMAHDDPAPPIARLWSARLVDYGYPGWDGCGENIAYNYLTGQSVFDAWMSDEGHKANIENSSWTTVGISCATVNQHIKAGDNSDLFGNPMWTQDFGTEFAPIGGTIPTPPVPPIPPAPPVPPITPVPKVDQIWRNDKGVMHTITEVTTSSIYHKPASKPRTTETMTARVKFLKTFTYVSG